MVPRCPDWLIAAISSTGDPNSFGYSTARERWPNILQSVIDDIQESMETCDLEKAIEGREIIAGVGKLRSEIINNHVLE